MKFRNLYIGQRFEFIHVPFSGMEHGPWVKVSTRKYRKDTSPFSVDRFARMEHETWCKLICQVGTINVAVNPM